MRTGGLLLPALLLVGAGCSRLDVPPETIVRCSSNDECPGALVCRTNVERCVDPDLLNAPGIEIETPVVAIPTTLGAGAGFDTATLTFATSVEPARMELALDGELAGECETDDGKSYTCTLTIPADAAEGPHEARVTVWDEIGNEEWSSATLFFDFTAPRVAEGTVALALEPAAASALDDVTHVRAGAALEIAFALDEPTSVAPVVRTAGDEAIAFEKVSPVQDAAALAFVYRLTFPADAVREGAWTIDVLATDEVGNEATSAEVASFVVDLTPPAAPAIQTAGAVTYWRAPWGTETTSGVPAFGVEVQAGGTEPDAVLVVTDGDDVATAAEIGRARADAAGAIPSFEINRADRPRVFVRAVDGAGNESAPVRVRDVRWTATLARKVPGSTFENPHDARVLTRFGPSLVGGSPALTPADLGRVDGAGAVARAATWFEPRQPVSGAPGGRQHGVLVADRAQGRLLLVGGDYLGAPSFATAWDGFGWTDVGAGNAPPRRAGAAVGWDARREVVVVFGGEDDGGFSDELWELAGDTWTQRTLDDGPSARGYAAAEYDDRRGVFVLFGGRDADGPVDETWELDDRGWTLRSLAAAPSARSGAASAWDAARGQLFLYGGTDGSGRRGDLWRFDGETWTEAASEGASTPPARVGASLGYDEEREQLVLHGGYTGQDPYPPLPDDTWSWDDASGWQPAASGGDAPLSTWGTLEWDPSRRVLVYTGGYTGTDLSAPVNIDDVYEWDGLAWRMRPPTAPFARRVRRAQAAWSPVAGGVVYLFGGEDAVAAGPPPPIEAEPREWTGTAYRPAGDQLSPPPATSRGSLVWDRANEEYLFLGGQANNANGATLRSAAGYAWLIVSTASPGRVYEGGMAYDESAEQAVLFGGRDVSTQDLRATTWLYASGTRSWARGTTTTTPDALAGHQLSWDATNERVLMFGGEADDGTRGELWAFAAGDWTQLSPATSPPARRFHAQAFDRVHGWLVVHGGLDADGDLLDDLWIFDGTDWRERPMFEAPVARWGHHMEYDENHEELWLFGGYDGATSRSDTFTLPSDRTDPTAVVLDFVFAAAGAASGTELVRADVEVVAGATSAATGAAGVTLHVWDRGRWIDGETVDASFDAPASLTWSSTDPQQLARLLVSRQERVHFATAPAEEGPSVGPGGRTRVTVDYAEVALTYREP